MIVIAQNYVLFADKNWQSVQVQNHNVLAANGVLLVPGKTHRHKIGGTVMVDGHPAKRAVVALKRGTLGYVGGTMSDPVTGEWEISGVSEYPERDLLVLSLDNTGYYNAEVADYISQVATV